MSIIYRIYSNHGSGGPVDYSAPVATTAGLSYTTAIATAPGDLTLAVRASDPATNLEESNADARVRIVIDANGVDVTGTPNAPHALGLWPTAGGGCRVTWAYRVAGQGGAPLGFHVYLTPGTAVDYSAPTASVAYIPGTPGSACALSGLADRAPYTVAVRSYNAAGTEGNTTAVASTFGNVTAPLNVDSLMVSHI